MAMVEDLGVFFDEDDFAVTATLNGVASGNVIVDRDYLKALGMVDSTDPMALAKAADYTAANIDATLVADSVSYKIVSVQPWGDGKTVWLQLETV